MNRNNWLLALVAVPVLPPLVLVAQGCFNPADTCLTHCWSHTQIIEDLDVDDSFDDTCVRDGFGGGEFEPPLPNLPLGAATGRVCVQTQADHNTIKKVITAIQEDDVNSLSGSEIQVYQDLIDDAAPDGIAVMARLDCTDFLSTECTDLIPGGNPDCCTLSSALSLCDKYVHDPALLALLDLDGGGTAQPVKSGTGSKTLGEREVCDFSPDLIGTGGGDDGDESTTAMSEDPFGDIQEAIYCNPQTSCEVLDELVLNVQENFDTFYREGIAMQLISSCAGNVKGAKLTGLTNGDYAKEIADELGIQNSDIITHVNNVLLDSDADVSDVLLWLSEGQDVVTFKIWRGSLITCLGTTYTYTIEVVDPPMAP